MAILNDTPEFDLRAEIDRIDRRRAIRQIELDRPQASSTHLWLWSLALILPITVGVILGLAL